MAKSRVEEVLRAVTSVKAIPGATVDWLKIDDWAVTAGKVVDGTGLQLDEMVELGSRVSKMFILNSFKLSPFIWINNMDDFCMVKPTTA